MGLEIWVYSGLTKAKYAEVDRDGYPKDWDHFWRAATVDGTEYSFPGRAAGLEQDAIYAYTGYSEFQAGSTKAYQRWRDTLAHIAGHASAESVQRNPPLAGPFVELIDFFDCGGVIGPVVAAKLAGDFAAFRKQAETIGGAFFDLYCTWQTAFNTAGGNGALRFATTVNDDQACRVCGFTDADMYSQPLEPIADFRYWFEDELCSACSKRLLENAELQPAGDAGKAPI